MTAAAAGYFLELLERGINSTSGFYVNHDSNALALQESDEVASNQPKTSEIQIYQSFGFINRMFVFCNSLVSCVIRK